MQQDVKKWLFALSVLGGIQQLAFAQVLPAPTGDYHVGRLRIHWTDSQRPEILGNSRDARREINVDIWYPAKRGVLGPSAEYLSDLNAIKAGVPEQEFTDEFDAAAGAVRAGTIKTHSMLSVPIAPTPRRFPVVVFSHGLGVPPEGYTTQAEDLASHGYVVVAIEHTYDAFVSAFPDGRIIDYEASNWDTKRGDEHAAYTKARVDVWSSDILFVIGKLHSIEATKSDFMLSGHLNLGCLAVVGHSMGGLAAIEACQKDHRIRACVDEDSLIYGTPFAWPDGRLTQPYMVLLTSTNFFPSRTDAQLARGGVDRATFNANVLRSQNELKTSLKSHGGIPTLAVFRDAAIEHMNFSDFKILQASDHAQTVRSLTAIEDVRKVVLSFLDSCLLGKPGEFRRLNTSVGPVRVIPLV